MFELFNTVILIFLLISQFIVIFCGSGVVTSRNPLYSLLFFIFTVLGLAGLLFILGMEFFAFCFLIIYIGAICILFMFVIMMLNLRTIELSLSEINYISLAGIIVFFLSLFFYTFMFGYRNNFNSLQFSKINTILWVESISFSDHLHSLGIVLYNFYPDIFIGMGIILLIAMIASIILTFEARGTTRNPYIGYQVLRHAKLQLKK